MFNSKDILLIIIILTIFFIKLNKAKKTNDLSKISNIEKSPIIRLKWFQMLFLLIMTLILVSNRFSDQTKNYAIDLLPIF
jgi:hypothetical protein